MNYLYDTKNDEAVKIAFKRTLDDILLLKPENITNPYKKSMGEIRTTDVSDLIDRINEKLQKVDLIPDEFVFTDNEDNDNLFIQLSFDFN